MHTCVLLCMQNSVNPPEMSVSRPSTRERSQLSTRERDSRASARRLAILTEDRHNDTAQDPGLTVEGQGLEGERINKELEERGSIKKEERALRLREELEHSLDTSDAVRMRRRHLSEV